MTTLFLDTFQGPSSLSSHTPNISAVPITWTLGASSGSLLSSGGLSHPAGSTLGALGTFGSFGSSGFLAGTRWEVTWDWIPAVDMVNDHSRDYPLLFFAGDNLRAGFLVNGISLNPAIPSAATLLISGGGAPVPVTYTAGTTYPGKLVVTDGLQTLTFLGQTLVANGTAKAYDDNGDPIPGVRLPLDWGDIYLKVGSTVPSGGDGGVAGHVLKFLRIDGFSDSPQWTHFVNSYEAT